MLELLALCAPFILSLYESGIGEFVVVAVLFLPESGDSKPWLTLLQTITKSQFLTLDTVVGPRNNHLKNIRPKAMIVQNTPSCCSFAHRFGELAAKGT
jgi:hypothetical protein